MKKFLICSLLLTIVAISVVLYLHPQQANAIPFSYNQTALSIPFTVFTKNASANSHTVLVEGGYNGSITSIYESHTDNQKLYYKLGYHPTLPISLDVKTNMTWPADSWTTDFFSTSGWTQTGSLINITSSSLLWSATRSNTLHAETFDLGSTVSNSQWTVRFQLPVAVLARNTNVGIIYFGLSDTANADSAVGNQDFLGFRVRTDTGNGVPNLWYSDGTTLDTGVSVANMGTVLNAGTYYIQIDRLTTTTFDVKIFSDSNYSVLVESSGAKATVATVQALRFIKICGFDVASAASTGVMSGSMNNLQVYDSTNSPPATMSLNISPSHNNRVTVVTTSYQIQSDTNHNDRITGVRLGSDSLNLVSNKTVTCGANLCSSEIWYSKNQANTGTQPLGITAKKLYYLVSGAYSFYNVRSIAPIGVNSTATGTSVTPSISLTPTFVGTSIILDNIISEQAFPPSANSNTKAWTGATPVMTAGSQYNLTPTIGGSNTLSWTTSNVQWASNGVELIPAQDQTTFNYYLSRVPFSALQDTPSNSSSIYFVYNAGGAVMSTNHIDTTTGVETHDFSTSAGAGTNNANYIFLGQKKIAQISMLSVTSVLGTFPSGANNTYGNANTGYISDYMVRDNLGNNFFFNSNSTNFDSRSRNSQCDLTYIPSNTTTSIDNIACDIGIPNHATRYWNGISLVKIGNYYTNSTLPLLSSVQSSAYKKQFLIPNSIYGIPDPDVRLLGHFNGVDFLMSYSSTSINYIDMPQLTTLLSKNRAFQGYMIANVNTDSSFKISPTSISPVVGIKFYGPSLNVTVSKYGEIMIPSGYTTRLDSTNEHDIRTLDPRWTNTPQQDYPAYFTSGSLFPVFLTVSNAPTDASLMVQSQSLTINNLAGLWSVVSLDTTHSAEFDITPNTCVNLYVADSSVAPQVYTYQGNVCATGVNQKTVYYTNTLPTTFYTMHYGATSTYTPSTNGLSTTVRSTTTPFTYNVLVRNSTGTITINFTKTVNSTSDTHLFNVSSTSKPGAVFVSIPGTGTIYSSYLGSSLSFASTVSFFHQYFSYQGFDLLSFIPIIFASMFTRNTIGIGMAMVVVLVATLSFLSVVVVSDATMGIMVVIALIGLIGYRGIYG